jgi:dTDP-4-amino-4,6-dideoxygalactose transaminase
MIKIIEQHGLCAAPVDINLDSCSLRCDLLEHAITPRTRAILVAHLFGSRMDMEEIVIIARRHNLYLFEDCAQAFAADGYHGHPGSDVAMISFGPIKTATALGGAIFSFRSDMLRDALKISQTKYPIQSQAQFLRQVLNYSLLKALSCRLPYSIFTTLCRLLGFTHDHIISNYVRAFAGNELLQKIRYQPAYALLALLARRLRRYTPARLGPRIKASVLTLTFLPENLTKGRYAKHHSHWIFPIQCQRPDQLVSHLWQKGFDATRGGSKLYAVPADDDLKTGAMAAHRVIERIVYLPVDSGASTAELRRLAETVSSFESVNSNTSPI